jgi:hypothetical protein
VVILDVRLEVAGQAIDAGRQQRDLNLRGAGIARGALVLLEDLRLF